jgi:hypothetical protein
MCKMVILADATTPFTLIVTNYNNPLPKIKHKKTPPTRRDFAWYKTHFSKLTAYFDKLSKSRGKLPITVSISGRFNAAYRVLYTDINLNLDKELILDKA